MDLILISILLLIVALLVWLVTIGIQLQRSLERMSSTSSLHLARQGTPLALVIPCCPVSTMTNFSTWTYLQGKWELAQQRIEPGFVAGDPPRRPGAYENESLNRPAVRAK